VARERVLKVTVLSDWRKFNADRAKAETGLAKFTGHTERLSKRLQGLGGVLTGGAIVLGLKKTIDAASAMNETVSKSRVVFGPAAAAVEKFASTAATSLGMSKQEALENTATLGNLFVSMKLGQRPAAEMSTKMVQLAADMASFNNASPQDTLEAIRAGLVGETEPLRKYGVNLNDAALRQEALRLGLVKTTKNVLPASIRAQAAYSLILQQSKTAQGDFARTSGGLANQQRILSAEFKDAQANLGKVLLPAMLSGVRTANRLLEAFSRLDDATGGLASRLGLGAAAIAGLGVVTAKVVGQLLTIRKAWIAYQTTKAAQVAVNAATTASEVTLTGATTASGAAAGTAAARWTALTAAVARFAVPVALVAGTLAALKTEHDRYAATQAKANALSVRQRDLALQGIGPGGFILGTRNAVAAATKAWQDYNAAQLDNAKTIPPLADRTNVLGSQLDRVGGSLAGVSLKSHGVAVSFRDQVNASKPLRDALLATRDAILSEADAFDHGRAASKVKTASVLADLRREVATLTNWATDAQTLIRRGMSPAAVKYLSDKGPQYVHAFATASDKQVAGFEKLFKGRLKASGDVAYRTTVGAGKDFQRLKEKANAETAKIKAAKARTEGREQAAREMRRFRNEANAALGGIHNKRVEVKAIARIDAKELRKGLQAIRSNTFVGLAGGGVVDGPGTPTSDTAGLFALSNEEMVIPAANVRAAGGPRAVASMVGMTRLRRVRSGGMATGGVVLRSGSEGIPRLAADAASAQRDIERTVANRAAGVVNRTVTRVLNALLAGIGGGGDAAIKRFIASTDRLPYRWGAAGPGAYDCSGLVGAVYGLMTGRGGGRGQRYFTTGSIGTGVPGIRPGLGGLLDIGVRRPGAGGSGHMAGSYGGLKFEARGTSSGIFVGPAARSPGAFGLHFHVGVPGGGGTGSAGGVKGIVREVFAGMFGWGSAGQWAATDALVSHESGWRPTAQNPSSSAYGLFQFLDCVPLDTECLTRDGWKHHDEVRVGDETLGFNLATGELEWTPITALVVKPGDEVIELSNGDWRARATPRHRWITDCHRFVQTRHVAGETLLVGAGETVSGLAKRSLGVQPVWCVQTGLGTWTMRQDGHAMLTGNSTWATVGGHKTSDPRLQAIYGGRYIRSRYHNPAGAWAFWLRHHSYDAGGWLPPGLSLAFNGTGRSEPVGPLDYQRLAKAFGRTRGVPPPATHAPINVTVPLTVVGTPSAGQEQRMRAIARETGTEVGEQILRALRKRGSGR
jgi:hypothetical protein